MISFIIPTLDRHDELARTLRMIGALERVGNAGAAGGMGGMGGEVIVVDNGGHADPPARLDNGLPVHLLRQPENRGVGARNDAADAASGDWLLMLDDDSAPTDAGFVDAIADAPDDVGAIGAEIRLPRADPPKREAGGLPEVIVGCGALIRRDAFLDARGYDPAFGYYVEEYDLCAKLLLDGWRVTHDRRFRVDHRKVEAGRDMTRIVRLLVRNGGWFAARYAPDGRRDDAIRRVTERCAQIAEREGVPEGYRLGMSELEATIDDQVRTPMSDDLHDRAIGLAAVRDAIVHHRSADVLRDRVALFARGKHDWCVEQALAEAGVECVGIDQPGVPRMPATLSPGPMLDALDAPSGGLTLAPWLLA